VNYFEVGIPIEEIAELFRKLWPSGCSLFRLNVTQIQVLRRKQEIIVVARAKKVVDGTSWGVPL
jgi:hypothetical protein